MAGAAAFLAAYTDEFDEAVCEDRYPGLPDEQTETTSRDAA